MSQIELPFGIKIEADDSPALDVVFDGGPWHGRRIIIKDSDPEYAEALVHDFGWRDGPEYLETTTGIEALTEMWEMCEDPETGKNPYPSLRALIEAGGGTKTDGMGNENGDSLSEDDKVAILTWLDRYNESVS